MDENGVFMKDALEEDDEPTNTKKDELYHKHKLKSFFLFKHLNNKKLSSHMWYFEGFCRTIKPKYCCLIDVGTKPDASGILR